MSDSLTATPSADRAFRTSRTPCTPRTEAVTSLGKHLRFGHEIEELRETTRGSADEMQSRLAEDGYLLLRGFHPRDEVLAARADLLDALRKDQRLAPGPAGDEGVLAAGCPGWMDYPQAVIRSWPRYQALVGGPRMLGLFADLLGGPAMTLDHKWLRIIAPGYEGTKPHCDIVYMRGGTLRLFTVWTPLGDIPLEMGPLMICPGAHRHQGLLASYGRNDAHLGDAGPLTRDPLAAQRLLGARWQTADFRAGDILVFGMFTLHASLAHCGDRVRLSTDTRYQLASEPADPRHMGDDLEKRLHPNLADDWLDKNAHLFPAELREPASA